MFAWLGESVKLHLQCVSFASAVAARAGVAEAAAARAGVAGREAAGARAQGTRRRLINESLLLASRQKRPNWMGHCL